MSEFQKLKQLKPRDYLLSVQHLFAMFGATVLVPLITGMNPSIALLAAGVGTLIFHLCSKGKVPVFLGSSFAFLGAISLYGADGLIHPEQLPKVQGGIIVAGAVYLVFSLIAKLVGPDNIKKAFPPIVTGPVIIVIGLNLAGTAIKDCGFGGGSAMTINGDIVLNFLIALFTLAVFAICSNLRKGGIIKVIPILIALASGYLLCVLLCAVGVLDWSFMNFKAIEQADWVNIPFVTKDMNGVQFMSLPEFDFSTILSIAPIALVTFMEHIGDITTNSMVVGQDFLKDPGLHRTLLGDGLATMFAGFIGGPANTTYSENTGVLATTKNYNPLLLRLTAVLAILLGFFGKFGALLQTIPCAVKGGVELMLFGTIAAIGIRSMIEAKVDFTKQRNLTIAALVLTTGIGINAIGGLEFMIGEQKMNISGLFVAVLIGVLLNVILPKEKAETKD